MRSIITIFSLLILPLFVVDAQAGSVLDRIKSQKVIRCGAVPRPGLLQVGRNGHASGLLLDLCRAIGA